VGGHRETAGAVDLVDEPGQAAIGRVPVAPG
jgi:hypothetical protein